MTKRHKIFMIALVLVLVLSSIPIYAASFSFSMVKGQSVSSAYAVKSNTRRFVDITSTGGNQVQNVELVYFRGRNYQRQYASNLAESYRYGNFTPSYFSGEGTQNLRYYLYGSLDSNNPYNSCTVNGYWYP